MNQEIPFCPFLAKDKFLFIEMNGKPFFDINLRNMKYKSLGRPFVPLLRLLPNHNTGLCPSSHFHFPLPQKKVPTSRPTLLSPLLRQLKVSIFCLSL